MHVTARPASRKSAGSILPERGRVLAWKPKYLVDNCDMSASEADKRILKEIRFAGVICVNGEAAPITFRVSAGADCRLLFDVDVVDAPTYLLAVSGPGRTQN
jgi:hypothetical protein